MCFGWYDSIKWLKFKKPSRVLTNKDSNDSSIYRHCIKTLRLKKVALNKRANIVQLTSSSLLLMRFLACAKCTGTSSSCCSAFTSSRAKQYFPCSFTTLPVSNWTRARLPRHWSKSPNWIPLPWRIPEGIFAEASSTGNKNATRSQGPWEFSHVEASLL